MQSARAQELGGYETMEEAVEALNRLAPWFGRHLGTSGDGGWKLGNDFSGSSVVLSSQAQLPRRPMAVIDFADNGSPDLDSRRNSLTTNPYFTSLCAMGVAITSRTHLTAGPTTRVQLSFMDVQTIERIPGLCEELILRPTQYLTESDYQLWSKGELKNSKERFITVPAPGQKLVKVNEALYITKEDYLTQLKKELRKTKWLKSGVGLFGMSITATHIGAMKAELSWRGNTEECFNEIMKTMEDTKIPDNDRQPFVAKLYDRLAKEMTVVHARCEERKRAHVYASPFKNN